MNKTRRAFLNAGSIIAIVLAVVSTLLGIISIVVAPFVSTENLCDIYEKDVENYKTYYVNDNKQEGIDHFVELNDRGEETSVIIYVKDLKNLAEITQTFLKSVGWGVIILEVASFITAIFVLKDASKPTNRIASIITLLVLSLFTGNMVTFAFMIVGLCLKNKIPVELEVENFNNLNNNNNKNL